MRNILIALGSFAYVAANGQLSITPIVPLSGIIEKQQLWNLALTNTELQPYQVQLQLKFSDMETGRQVFVASSVPFYINPGVTQLNQNSIAPVTYVVLNPDYRIDPGPIGLLPVGSFRICYEIMIIKYNKIIQECISTNIEPLAPLLLTFPANSSEVDLEKVNFGWLPPSFFNLSGSLRYEFTLTEILENQSPEDAVKNNMPLVERPNEITTNLAGEEIRRALEPGKDYAWKVTAYNNLSRVTSSDTWRFSTNEADKGGSLPTADPVFVKLSNAAIDEGAYIFWNEIRFNYINEGSDTTWMVLVEDLTNQEHSIFLLEIKNIALKRGQNLVTYPAFNDKRFKSGRIYRLQIRNSLGESKYLRFEYRKK